MHLTQLHILKSLLFSDTSRFADLKPSDMEGSQFTFHLETLSKQKLVMKTGDGQYTLTEKGKNMANRIDFDSDIPNMQAKHSAVFCATRDNNSEILIYKRLKNPFYGHYGFPTGKVQYGERILETAQREFEEETNLKGNPYLTAIRHYRVYCPNKESLVEDKVMYIHRIEDPSGSLKSNEEGKFYWKKPSEAQIKGSSPLPEFEEMLEIILKFDGTIDFKEIDHITESF